MLTRLALIGSLAATVLGAALPQATPSTVIQSAWFASDYLRICDHGVCTFSFNIVGSQDVPAGPGFNLTCHGVEDAGKWAPCTYGSENPHLVSGASFDLATRTVTVTVIHDFVADSGKSYVTSGVAAFAADSPPTDFLIHQSKVTEV